MIGRWIGKTFGKGLIVVLPLAVTIYLVLWIGSTIEGALGKLMPEGVYFPGLGLLLGLVVVFAVGVLLWAGVGLTFGLMFEGFLKRIPLINSLYGSLRDLMDFFSGQKKNELNRVVMVTLDEAGRQRLMGFVTRESFDDLPDGIGDENCVAVYVPMSYQLGGFTYIVPRDCVQPVDMSIEHAMRFALTAGVKKEEEKAGETPPMTM